MEEAPRPLSPEEKQKRIQELEAEIVEIDTELGTLENIGSTVETPKDAKSQRMKDLILRQEEISKEVALLRGDKAPISNKGYSSSR